ncbi:hypothetical protein COO60DRAFT_802581 [Scenedesmus sp. NREL 46B-D3]|nr:hypothetical protein COO60DRAFT_802581 [Scenedesmus sp. NREL 46B-D3]
MATAASLQAHSDEISALAAVLPLAAAPRGFAQLDIASLADSPEAATKVSSILSKAAAGLQECQVCGCSCSAGQLGFLVTTQLDFAARSVRAAAGQFACEVCRALSSPGLLLELSMPVPQSEDFTRAEQLRELFLHFAAVNAAPERITCNPEALALWVQELASRAYSMHVVASSLKGWRLHSPSGQLVQSSAAGAALQLLRELLHQGASSKTGNATAGKQQQQQQQLGSTSAAKAAKRKSVVAAQEAAAGSSKKARKLVDTPAAAGAAGKHTPVHQGEATAKQQAKTPKQQKQQQQPVMPRPQPQQQQTPKQQQQQQQPGQTGKVQEQVAKISKASAAVAAHGQQQPQAGGTSSKKKKKLSSHSQASHTADGEAAAGAPGRKLKTAAAAAAVPFKTPQVANGKKAKRRLSAEL